MVQPLRRTVWQLLKRLNTEVPRHPAVPLVNMVPKGTDNMFTQKRDVNAHSSIIQNSQNVETTLVSIN